MLTSLHNAILMHAEVWHTRGSNPRLYRSLLRSSFHQASVGTIPTLFGSCRKRIVSPHGPRCSSNANETINSVCRPDESRMLRRDILFAGATGAACLPWMTYAFSEEAAAYDENSVFGVTASMYGRPYPLSQHEGKVMCIVNVASM